MRKGKKVAVTSAFSYALSTKRIMPRRRMPFQSQHDYHDSTPKGGKIYSKNFRLEPPSKVSFQIADFAGALHIHLRNVSKNGTQYLHLNPNEYADLVKSSSKVFDCLKEGSAKLEHSRDRFLVFVEPDVEVIDKCDFTKKNEEKFERARALFKKEEVRKKHALTLTPSSSDDNQSEDEDHVLNKIKRRKKKKIFATKKAAFSETDDESSEITKEE